MKDVTQLLNDVGHGDPHAASRQLPLVYDELRQGGAKPRDPQTDDPVSNYLFELKRLCVHAGPWKEAAEAKRFTETPSRATARICSSIWPSIPALFCRAGNGWL
jgi:hypothetical protein